MPTSEQDALIKSITVILSADPQIEAAWLSGSLGYDGGDAFSDVDIVALVTSRPVSDVSRQYAERADEIAPSILVNLLFDKRVLSVVTADWQRYDIAFVDPAALQRYDVMRMKELFNRGNLRPPVQVPIAYTPPPETVLRIIKEFLRVLGLFAVAVGREEWVTAQSGMEILRRLTIDLMLEENRLAPTERGGALHLNRLLTPEQRGLLEALPPVSATRESAFAGNSAVAALFLPRARRLAEDIGVEWPSAFEAATRDSLKRRIGFSVP